MSAGPSPVGRLRAAADTLDRLAAAVPGSATWWAFGEFLAVDTGQHNCAGGTVEASGMHEPGCGYEPVLQEPEPVTALIAATAPLAGPVAAWLRATADQLQKAAADAAGFFSQTGDAPETLALFANDLAKMRPHKAALAVADAVLASTRETREESTP